MALNIKNKISKTKDNIKSKKDKLHVNKHVHKFPTIDGWNPKTVFCKCGDPCVFIPPTKMRN